MARSGSCSRPRLRTLVVLQEVAVADQRAPLRAAVFRPHLWSSVGTLPGLDRPRLGRHAHLRAAVGPELAGSSNERGDAVPRLDAIRSGAAPRGGTCTRDGKLLDVGAVTSGPCAAPQAAPAIDVQPEPSCALSRSARRARRAGRLPFRSVTSTSTSRARWTRTPRASSRPQTCGQPGGRRSPRETPRRDLRARRAHRTTTIGPISCPRTSRRRGPAQGAGRGRGVAPGAHPRRAVHAGHRRARG